jgi:hypothetical protein
VTLRSCGSFAQFDSLGKLRGGAGRGREAIKLSKVAPVQAGHDCESVEKLCLNPFKYQKTITKSRSGTPYSVAVDKVQTSPHNTGMANKGKTAWLITLEGITANRKNEFRNRPKVVAVLSPRLSERDIAMLIRILYYSESGAPLSEKLCHGLCIRQSDSIFKVLYRDYNRGCSYGDRPFLYARKVKNIRCREDPKDQLEEMLSWTELAKYRYDDAAAEKAMIAGERNESYMYSFREAMAAE